jgi:hypothetical protein
VPEKWKKSLGAPDVDDLLDDVAESVEDMDEKVIVVPSERMPAATGVAATFRYNTV